ncbi:MAG: radical SAM protein [Desulfobacterales bacterium]|nr:radical SAM protein [Desulfobacterales bacterium]MBL7225810.1 radical SAM protein [Desulfobacteraceae bacterium]
MSSIKENNGITHALLLEPPPGDLTGPYPALPYLKSFAQQNGYKVRLRDLGIEALHFLVNEHQIRDLLDRAEAMRGQLETKRSLDPSEQNHYGLLLMAMGLGLKPNLISKALSLFKDSKRFYDYRRYKESCHFLDGFYGLLRAVHYPTMVTHSEYPTVRMLKTMREVLAHRDRTVNPYIDYYEKILFPQVAADSPSVIGISMVFASQSVQALVLGSLLKERFPEIHVTIGGAYFSQWVILMREPELSELFACTDSVICGEGEKPFSDLLAHVVNNLPLDNLPNVIYRNPSTGEFHRFVELEYTDITKQPPPDFSDLDLSAYLIPEPIIPYCISRGCYWGKCVFCQNRYGDYHMRRYQSVPVEKAIVEMSQLAEQYNTNHFNFSNDVIDPTYLRKFSEVAIASGKKFVWNTDLRAEKDFTVGLSQLMARAGLNCVAIGFESGCQRILDVMQKGNRVETSRRVMKNLYDAGVATQAMGFFGFPGETEKDGERTVRFLEENVDRISYYVMGLLLVLPGSRMYDNPRKYGATSISYDGNPMMAPEPIWRSEIRMSTRAVSRLYNRLSQLEDIYAINDYPYVGALSTNHSFLYFEQGPDILKRLRMDEKKRHLELHRILGIDHKHKHTKQIKSVVPRIAFPFVIYRSPFPFQQMQIDPQSPPNQHQVFQGAGWDYLVDPINMPVRIGEYECKLLGRIDGKRKLKSILIKIKKTPSERLIYFLMHLIQRGLVRI